MVTALDRKLLRDLWQMRAQIVAITLVLASAIAILLGSLGTYRALVLSRDDFYQSGRFADVFASLSRAPLRVADRIAAVPGVAELQARVVDVVPLEQAGLRQSKSALLVSLPDGCDGTNDDDKACRGLNAVRLLSGRLPAVSNEVVASQAFVEANQIQLGNSIYLLIRGQRQPFRIVGVAISPEFIYVVRPGEMMPDDANFGIVWMQQRTLASALDMQGAFNNLILRLSTEANVKQVMDNVDRQLAAYGGQGAYTRVDHVSHRFLADDIEQLRLIAVLLPSIFFAVAAYLLNMVLSRLVDTQRQLIAALKALGYTSLEIALHYIKLVTMIVFAAVVVGSLGGELMAQTLSRFYAQDLYRLPELKQEPQLLLMLLATFFSLGAAYAGVARAVYSAARLPPAEAMRAKAPASYRPTLLERFGIGRLFSQPGRMVLRSLGRNPWRTLLSSTGLALAVAILVAAGFFSDAIGYMVSLEFEHAHRQDLTVTFATPQSSKALLELSRLPQVLSRESFRQISVELDNSPKRQRVALMGLQPDGKLRRVLDHTGTTHKMPSHGLLLSEKLAEMLQVAPGDSVQVSVIEGERLQFTLVVEALVSDVLGTNAYLSQQQLNRLLKQGELYSGAFLTVDKAAQAELTRTLRAMPGVAGVSSQDSMMAAFERFTGAVILVFAGVLVLFAVILVIGVAYNAARILLAEREQELATLRVIGMTRTEISVILLSELGAQVALAIPLGLLMGYGLAAAVCHAMTSDLMRLPLLVSETTLAFATVVCFAASLIAALIVRRRLDHLDLVAVLKTKE